MDLIDIIRKQMGFGRSFCRSHNRTPLKIDPSIKLFLSAPKLKVDLRITSVFTKKYLNGKIVCLYGKVNFIRG